MYPSPRNSTTHSNIMYKCPRIPTLKHGKARFKHKSYSIFSHTDIHTYHTFFHKMTSFLIQKSPWFTVQPKLYIPSVKSYPFSMVFLIFDSRCSLFFYSDKSFQKMRTAIRNFGPLVLFIIHIWISRLWHFFHICNMKSFAISTFAKVETNASG